MIPRIFLPLIVLASGLAQAATYQINLGGQDMSNQMVNIQQLIYQTYPGVQLQPNSILRQVIVLGKGYDSSSSVELYMDNRLADSKMLQGIPQNYYLNDFQTFSNLSLINTTRAQARSMDLNFRGFARVLTITVDIIDMNPRPPRPPRPPGPPPPYPGPQPYPPQPYPPQPYPPQPQPRIQFVDIGTERTQKFLSSTRTFATSNWNDFVNQVIITGTVEKSNIERVLVIFADGTSRDLQELVRVLGVGQQAGAYLGNRQIREIQIQSTSGNLSGSRGEFKVTLGILR